MRKIFIIGLALAACAALAIPALAATKSITVGDNFFVRHGGTPTVTVAKGTTLKFLWKGHAPHNVTVTKGPAKFRSSTMTSGSYAKKLTKAGTYTIICTIHQPNMKMIVKVR
jgi:plastocyanin